MRVGYWWHFWGVDSCTEFRDGTHVPHIAGQPLSFQQDWSSCFRVPSMKASHGDKDNSCQHEWQFIRQCHGFRWATRLEGAAECLLHLGLAISLDNFACWWWVYIYMASRWHEWWMMERKRLISYEKWLFVGQRDNQRQRTSPSLLEGVRKGGNISMQQAERTLVDF